MKNNLLTQDGTGKDGGSNTLPGEVFVFKFQDIFLDDVMYTDFCALERTSLYSNQQLSKIAWGRSDIGISDLKSKRIQIFIYSPTVSLGYFLL